MAGVFEENSNPQNKMADSPKEVLKMLLKALIGKLAYVVWLFLMIAAVSFAYAQVVVPEGNVAFVIASDDDVTPTLTSREDAVAYKLRSLGYTNITYISPVKLAGADFSKARLVISTEEKTLDANTVKSLIESGRGVVLLYNAASSLGGTWNSSYGSDWGSIYLEKDASFLKGYAADLPFQVQISDHFEKTA
ncbi:hypothetical protein HYR99_08565, partial [Candidatus Poribacteria bacterium]|nr:hypothetical protein [Candidatus Poribacteria bacterium]